MQFQQMIGVFVYFVILCKLKLYICCNIFGFNITSEAIMGPIITLGTLDGLLSTIMSQT